MLPVQTETSKLMHKDKPTLGWTTTCKVSGALICFFWMAILECTSTRGQSPQCDPKKVVTSAGCIQCHTQADAVWKRTPHFISFNTLHRQPEAKVIAKKMGIISIKRSDVCVGCHYTQIEKTGSKPKAISGVSCESCHGAGRDWVNIHHDYGGPSVTKSLETPTHAELRLEKSSQNGMRNPKNLFLMAKSCLTCHTVPNEKLVNIGGHSAGSLDFDFVTWSQGTIRHNFLRSNGQRNATTDDKRLRIMWVAGLLADLELSTRATAAATQKQNYGITVAKRAARVSLKLYEVQQKIENPHLEKALIAFSDAELKINNKEQLEKIADQIEDAGMKFAANAGAGDLIAIADQLPAESSYK